MHRRPGAGRAFAILLDDLFIHRFQTRDVRDAVLSFLDRSTVDGDLIMLGNTMGDLWTSARVREGREDLKAVLARFQGREDGQSGAATFWNTQGALTEYHAFEVVEGRRTGERGLARQIDAYRRQRMKRTLGAMRRQIESLASLRGRKSLFLVTQGFVQDSSPELRDIAAASRGANVAIYFLDTRGLLAPSTYSAANAGAPDPTSMGAVDFERRLMDSAGSQDLASDTGGLHGEEHERPASGHGSYLHRIARVLPPRIPPRTGQAAEGVEAATCRNEGSRHGAGPARLHIENRRRTGPAAVELALHERARGTRLGGPGNEDPKSPRREGDSQRADGPRGLAVTMERHRVDVGPDDHRRHAEAVVPG